MGRGNWFKAMICLGKESKQVKVHSTIEKLNGKFITDETESSSNANGGGVKINTRIPGLKVEEDAAIRIQRAYRRSIAKKGLNRFKGATRFHDLIRGHNQTSITLGHIHSWCKIQSEISSRRLHMVTESRARQKKMESQLKLEAKLRDVEVEWNGGSKTMEEILSRVQQREEATIKRERAMAYAFSHQWRANNTQYLGQAYYTIGKDKWGWSWKERWIAARPWEVRVHAQLRIAKTERNHHHHHNHSRQESKVITKQLELKLPAASLKLSMPICKASTQKCNKLPNPNPKSPIGLVGYIKI